MNASTMSRMIGARGWYRTSEGLRVALRVVDAKQAYGVCRYLVEPVSGEGSAWINAERFQPTIGAADEKGGR